MYEHNRAILTRSTQRSAGGDSGPSGSAPRAIPRLATRRDLLRGVLLGGAGLGLAGYSRLARGGYSVNLGPAPQLLGYLNPTLVQNNFNNMVANHPAKITAAGLNAQEASILAARYPADVSAYIPAGTVPHQKYVQTRGFLPCPPTLGCVGGLDGTLQEIYLDFRLFGGAPAGGVLAPLSVPAATLATTIYYGGLVWSAYQVGFAAGSYLVGWMQKYDTTSWDQIVTLTGSAVNAASWFASSMQNMASDAYNYGNNLFGRDAWNFNNQFFAVSPYSIGIGGSLGYGNSYGFGVFDDISFLDIDPSGGGCFNPMDC